MRAMTTAARIALVAVVLTAGAAACDDDDDSAASSRPDPGAGATTFAGTAEGGGTYVAIVVDAEGDALAYATDGDRSVDWLYGMVDNGTGSLDNDGGAVLDVTVGDDRASGTFTRPDSEPLRFSAEPASSPAGLYRAQDSFADGDYVAGWIVLPDGTQRGSVRRYETPLTPGTVDATTFSTGDDTFTVPGGELRVRRIGATADV
jgi:hypothetical protein